MNCIANDSKCTKFRNIYFLFAPAPEEKIIIWCMLQWIMKVNKIKGFLQSWVLQPGVLTIKASQNQGFLQSGACISVSYMTGLCPDVDIDHCSLQSGVQINVCYMTGLCPDVDIDHCSLHTGVQINMNRSLPSCIYILIITSYN